MLPAGKRALHRAELWRPKLFRELSVKRDLRTAGIDKEGDFVLAVYAHVYDRKRIGPHEFQARTFLFALQIISLLALEALQLRNVQRRVLLTDQLVAADVDAFQRSRCLLKIVAAIKHFGQHDLGVGITWVED